MLCNVCRLLGYEGLEVINPDGGTDDAEEEALKGRWKQEVKNCESSSNNVLLESREDKFYLNNTCKLGGCSAWISSLDGKLIGFVCSFFNLVEQSWAASTNVNFM